MTSEAVRLARLQDRAEARREHLDFAKRLIDNPVVEFAALIAVLEMWYAYKARRPGVDKRALDLDSLLLWGSGSAILAAHQLAPIVPDLLRGGSAAAGALTPLLAKAVVK